MVVLDKYTEAKGIGLFNESVTTPVIDVCAIRLKLKIKRRRVNEVFSLIFGNIILR